MCCRIHLHFRTEQYPVSDPDHIAIENDAIEIRKEVVPDGNVYPVVAIKGRSYLDILTAGSQKIAKNAAALCGFFGAGHIKIIQELPRPGMQTSKLLIICDVQLSGEHTFTHRLFLFGIFSGIVHVYYVPWR